MKQSVTLSVAQKQILQNYGLSQLCDILEMFPARYEVIAQSDESTLKIGQSVIIEGVVISAMQTFRYQKNRSVTRFHFASESNQYQVSIFNRPWLKSPSEGTVCTLVGKLEATNKIVATNLTFQPLAVTGGIHPIYPLKASVKQNQIKTLIKKALLVCQTYQHDVLPTWLMSKRNLLANHLAIYHMHQPTDQQLLDQALLTIKTQEFIQYQARLLLFKDTLVNQIKKQRQFDDQVIQAFIQSLPFTLTKAQQHVVNELLADIKAPVVMNRLLQGDVGSGKTIVALIGAVASMSAGYQVAVMAPTEILAQQHLNTFTTFLKDTPYNIGFLTGSMSVKEKNAFNQQLMSHQLDIVIGTHALFSQSIEFKQLGLIITDEQHRFGVMQRKKMILKAEHPDVLSMSATPIPRTLATVLFSDMDISTIDQAPPNKGKIKTVLIKENSIRSILDDILATVALKQQVLVVCPAIEDQEDQHFRSVTQVYQAMQKAFKGTIRIGQLHGQMDKQSKEEVLTQLHQQQLDLVVATTIIEVGIDLPKATRLIIYDAHRFGLSALHQLRGRIGRRLLDGICYLLTNSEDEQALARLQVLVDYESGFDIAYQDLRLRGPGDVLGERQSGLPPILFSHLLDDQNLLHQSKADAIDLLAASDDQSEAFKQRINNQLLQLTRYRD